MQNGQTRFNSKAKGAVQQKPKIQTYYTIGKFLKDVGTLRKTQ